MTIVDIQVEYFHIKLNLFSQKAHCTEPSVTASLRCPCSEPGWCVRRATTGRSRRDTGPSWRGRSSWESKTEREIHVLTRLVMLDGSLRSHNGKRLWENFRNWLLEVKLLIISEYRHLLGKYSHLYLFVNPINHEDLVIWTGLNSAESIKTGEARSSSPSDSPLAPLEVCPLRPDGRRRSNSLVTELVSEVDSVSSHLSPLDLLRMESCGNILGESFYFYWMVWMVWMV